VRVAEGVALEVPRQGSGAPLLLLPGFGTDASVFAAQIPDLAASFEVFGVNPRGVGASDAPEAEVYDVATAADDAAAISPGAVHVVGASLGAAVALELALRHPQRVRSLSLIAPLFRPGARLLAVTEAWCRLAAEASPDALALALLPWFFSPHYLADEARRARTRRGLAASLSRVGPTALVRWSRGLAAWSREPSELAAIAAPTLVLVGGGDLLTPGGEELARAIAGARCVVVPGAGHALGIEAPELVSAALRVHLGVAA
jgi:pimeloyl-ACP methyl ester carboxylesterase